MRIVCYKIDFVIIFPNGEAKPEQLCFFGFEDKVNDELALAEKAQSQAIIVHAADPSIVAQARAKLQIVRQLLRHDINKVPMYPVFGTGNKAWQDKDFPMGFQVMIAVSQITDGNNKPQDLTKPVNIVLPAGVSL